MLQNVDKDRTPASPNKPKATSRNRLARLSATRSSLNDEADGKIQNAVGGVKDARRETPKN
jgi:hypothetical protein